MDEFQDFMRDVPRGDSTRYLNQQRAPQARWMRLEDIAASDALAYDPRDPGRKILVGALGSRLIGIDDPRHILTVAGSQSGKSVGLVGNLHFYQGSVLATDPKGELAGFTAKRRADIGQRVYVLDPFGTAPASVKAWRASYNPMDVLTLDSPTLLEDAALIAEGMVMQAVDARDPHWDESAKNFIEGVIVHVATSETHAHRSNLVTVRELVKRALWVDEQEAGQDTKAKKRPTLFLEMMENANSLKSDPDMDAIGSALMGAAMDFYGKGENEQAGVLSTVQRHTKFLDYAAFRSILTRSDFRLEELKTASEGMTVYLCFPGMRMELAKRWLRIFVNQMLNAMESEKTKPPVPVLACLDEFPVLGYMKALEIASGLLASTGVKLWAILQDWNQGKALYGERWETFAGNAGTIQFFGNNDLTTTEYVSRLLGKTQVAIARSNEIAPDQQDKGLSGRSESIELYDLLTPDEITRQFSRSDRLKRQLVLWPGHFPMILQRVVWYDSTGPLASWL